MKNNKKYDSSTVEVDGDWYEKRRANPWMSEALIRDLQEYGFYEIFAAAEQLWAIEVGLAEKIKDWNTR